MYMPQQALAPECRRIDGAEVCVARSKCLLWGASVLFVLLRCLLVLPRGAIMVPLWWTIMVPQNGTTSERDYKGIHVTGGAGAQGFN